MSEVRALVVDGNLDSRAAMKRAANRAGLTLAGESGYGTEAVSLALEVQPEVVLVSVEEPAARALDTVDGLVNSVPSTPVIVYSTLSSPEALRRAMVVGAREYVIKPVEPEELRGAVRTALRQETRRELQRAGVAGIRGRGTIITVAAAKGGVGKSVITVNLATALRTEPGRSLVVIDGDTHFGDIATMFDLTPAMTVSDLTRRLPELNRDNVREYVTHYERRGIDVLAASTEDEDAWTRCSLEDITRVIGLFAQVYDFVLIDTSGGLGSFVRACIELSTLTLMITSDDVSSVRDTAVAAQRLLRWGIPSERVLYVLNRGNPQPGVKPRDIAEAIGRPLSWIVPYDPAVLQSVQTGEPLVLLRRRSSGARVIEALATVIGGAQGSGEQPSFFGRLLTGKGAAG